MIHPEKEFNSDRTIVIIQDMRNWFWKTYPNPTRTQSLDVDQIKENFESHGYSVELTRFDRFDFSQDYCGKLILYGSSEDFAGGTKSFMEDVLLWLELQGAILIPSFKYFRAHHNKVMMELLRHDFQNPALKTIHSTILPSAKAGQEIISSLPSPAVIKSASGAGSNGVFLARLPVETLKKIKLASRAVEGFPYYWIKLSNARKYVMRKAPLQINQSKYVVQNFIQGMQGDYKVLIFGNHYFVLYRLNRPHDFRASGSGVFIEKTEQELFPVLDFARQCMIEMDTPFLSVDIGFDGTNFHLIEFQCVSFGFKAMSLSTSHFIFENQAWQKIEGRVTPEIEFSQAVVQYFGNSGLI